MNTQYELQLNDLIAMFKDGEVDVMVHGCNCFCNMGAGIARAIKTYYPSALKEDKKTPCGDKNKLGTYSVATIERENAGVGYIVNAYTQYRYGGGVDNFSYETFDTLLSSLWQDERFKDKVIGIPLIGCGLAGGDMNKILNTLIQSFQSQATEQTRLLIVEREIAMYNKAKNIIK